MNRSCNYGAVPTFNLPNCLQVIGCRGELPHPKEETKGRGDLAQKLFSIICQYVRGQIICHVPTVLEYCRYLRQNDFWLWELLMSVQRVCLLWSRQVDFPSWSSVAVLEGQTPWPQGIMLMGRAEASTYPSLKITSRRMSDIRIQVCTQHSPCEAIWKIVASCLTCVSPWGVLPLWESEKSIRWLILMCP